MGVKPFEYFHFCPRCGRGGQLPGPHEPFRCSACQFTYFFNPAIAAAAFITNPDGLVLFIRRAKEPAKGKLALPGGFIDAGETAEQAVRREAREEVGLELASISYLSSHPNTYPYRDVSYPVLDFFFLAEAQDGQAATALDGVASYSWLEPAEVNPDDLAFASIRAAWECYLKILKSPPL